jgi:CRP-like cAMP-binding protein/tRNA A-37 threonylcarbamoyl transferase component Bud32
MTRPPLPATTHRNPPADDETFVVGMTLPSATIREATGYDLPPRFEMRREVAAGGMGVVLDVFDHTTRRRVAIKVLHPSLASRIDEISLFIAEAHVTGRLDHPNIVPVHDLYIDPARGAFFVMKLIEGDTLSTLVRKGLEEAPDGRALERLLGVFLKVCEAVEFAHSRSVIHLDLKPSNIMVGSHGQVYVMDWGIAVECRRDSKGRLRPTAGRRSARGTLAYMPPEQLAVDLAGLDERADVYGLGAILYEMLTGEPPFLPLGDSRDTERLRDHVVPPPAAVIKDRLLPPGLCAIAMRALARDPEARYPSVQALQADVESFLRGGGWFASRTFVPGEEIVAEGEIGDAAYIIVEGECEVVQGSGSARIHLRRMQPRDVFGETALLTSGRRTATVVALTEVTVLVVTRDSLERELSARGWLGKLVHVLAHRFREVDAERAALRESVG